MTVVLYLLAMSLFLGACGLAVFLWSLRSGQYEDMDGAANRILFDDPVPVKSALIKGGTPDADSGRRAGLSPRSAGPS